MLIQTICADMDISVAELARRLGVSDGHLHDLIGGRRKLSLKMAAKIEAVTKRKGIVAEVVRAKTAQ